MHLLTTVAWYSTWSSIVWGLHSHTNAARRPERAMQTVLLCKRLPTASNNLYRGRYCYTTHAAKATYRYFLGTQLRLPRRLTLERVPADWYFLFSACGVDMLAPRPSPLQLDIGREFKPIFKADSYGNGKLIRKWTKFVFIVFFQSYRNENGPDPYIQIRLNVS